MPTMTRSRRQTTSRPLSVCTLEDRWTPSTGSLLGTAANYSVLGLQGTTILNNEVRVAGNEGVSQGGALKNKADSTITKNVFEYSKGEYSGNGKLRGQVVIDADRLAKADQDALQASLTAASQIATQTFGSIKHSTVVLGNGGVNVISINGNITDSLILRGSASDIFIVNVSGTLKLRGNSTLGLAGGVTASHVLYNFTGAGTISVDDHDVVNGTLLAPHYSVQFEGVCKGAIIAGGDTINLKSHARVKEIDFTGQITLVIVIWKYFGDGVFRHQRRFRDR